jgi:hypothetical protein
MLLSRYRKVVVVMVFAVIGFAAQAQDSLEYCKHCGTLLYVFRQMPEQVGWVMQR